MIWFIRGILGEFIEFVDRSRWFASIGLLFLVAAFIWRIPVLCDPMIAWGFIGMYLSSGLVWAGLSYWKFKKGVADAVAGASFRWTRCKDL